jgi:3-oxoacyl-[acyl-carrier protein] reductase
VTEENERKENDMKTLDGQIALVTGGATGIGAAIVAQLAARGARVGYTFHTSRHEAELLAKTLNRDGERVFPVEVDICDSRMVKAGVDSITDHFGKPVSVLVNNAGDIVETMVIEEMPEAVWDKIINVNLKGAFLCSKYCIPGMRRLDYGRIVNISSLAARAGGGPGAIPYAVAKGGVESFSRGLAKELGPFHITVNTVAPGVIYTRILERYDVVGPHDEFKKRSPLSRIGNPEEVAAAVVFLASPEASYITGELISVNGGVRFD